MAKLKFGPIYTRIQDLVGPGEFGSLVEGLDFDSLWVTDSLAPAGPSLDSMITLAALAQATSRVTLGPCVLLMPVRIPALVSKEVATLDILSGGRFVLGVGVGEVRGVGTDVARKKTSVYEMCGVDLSERGARCDEGLEIMIKLWTGEPVSHSGRFYSFEDAIMGLRPVQKPHPPIWVGGEAEGVLKRTARWGDGWIPVTVSPATFAELLAKINCYAEEFGRDISSLTKALHLYIFIGDSRQDAVRRANEAISTRYGRTVKLEETVSCAMGDAEDCIEAIESYASVGVEHFVLNFSCSEPEVVPQIERFASEIMPT